ncbi:MAG: UDP-N-acetylglucosamine 2-epimerase (hydrolyzing) [Aeriscardovia sp.]|nr:UDP-N-acetylglucosamine 2-epimerase (hydrolyzing) [Aeriscardovia sp.]MBR2756239.1 UDP-N-acetylglucosamine 2-epimerase (hydrolyzing) [Lachnospiraceae bacterium]
MFDVQVLTSTRAEYGLLRTLIFRMQQEEELKVSTLVTGMHLSDEFGQTYRQIEEDGVEIAVKIPILLSNDDPASVSKAMGLAMLGFADYFAAHRPDCIIVLGDRFETLAVCCAAFNEHIPVVHLHGGEKTEGALDEAYRHAITKLSCLHFASTEEYRRRVIQLGENPGTVFNTGALGVENVKNLKLPDLSNIENDIGFSLRQPYAVVTFHPSTMEKDSEQQCHALIDAMDAHAELRYLCTKANADAGGRLINRMLEEFAAERDNVILVDSLGALKYLCAVKHAALVLGNSSSGLLEVPSFGVPTVNIGSRQKGRIRAESVIDCESETKDIIDAISKALSNEMQEKARSVHNPYEGHDTSGIMTREIIKMLKEKKTNVKTFYDI